MLIYLQAGLGRLSPSMDLRTTSSYPGLGVLTRQKNLTLVPGSNLLKLAPLWIPMMPLFFPPQEARPITQGYGMM